MNISNSVRVLGNGLFNLFLAGGEEKVIIECGVSGVVPLVGRQIGQSGQAAMIGRVVVMHAHFDHVCGLPGLRRMLPAARAAASDRAREVLAKQKVISHFFREDEAMTGTLKTLTGIAGEAEGSPENVPPQAGTLEIDEIVGEGTAWQLGPNFTLRFDRAPGHSPCSVTAYCPQEEILFSSDSAGFPVSGDTIFPIFFDGYGKYMDTIKRMAELPVSVLAGAHGEVITGSRRVREYLRLAMDWAEKTMSWTVKEAGRGSDPEGLALDIFRRFYRDRLRIYTGENIMTCSRLIVKRSIEASGEIGNQGSENQFIRRL